MKAFLKFSTYGLLIAIFVSFVVYLAVAFCNWGFSYVSEWDPIGRFLFLMVFFLVWGAITASFLENFESSNKNGR